MAPVDLRYMQVTFTVEEAAHLPGISLTNDFNKVEFLTKLKDTKTGMQAIIRVEYDDVEVLDKPQGAFKTIRILEQSSTSALCEIIATGPLATAFSALEHAWWVPPTYVHPKGMIITIRGTKDGLKEGRKTLKDHVGDGFKMILSVPDAPDASDALSVSAQRRAVEALMLSLSQDAKLLTAFGKQLSYTLPLASTDVSKIFNTMEEEKRKRVIVEWGLSQASLEEVFMKVVTAYEERRNPLLGAMVLAGDAGNPDDASD